MSPLSWYINKICSNCKDRKCEVLTPGMIRRGDPAGITACLMAMNLMLEWDRVLVKKIMKEGRKEK